MPNQAFRIDSTLKFENVADVFEQSDEGVAEANARLIALSPEMLDGLIAIRTKTESLDYEDGDDEAHLKEHERALDEIRDIAYALINRATAA